MENGMRRTPKEVIDYLDGLPSSTQFLLVGLVVSLFVMVVTL